jgi:CheY-like chemotaxis protein
MMKRKPRVLLVDDEVGLTNLLRRSLEQIADYEVRAANSGASGLTAMRDFQPDIVLLDVLMPGMTGREVADAMRGDPDLVAIPVVFVTALPPTEGSNTAAGTLDGWPCIEKPLSTDAIVAAIESSLKIRHAAKLEG